MTKSLEDGDPWLDDIGSWYRNNAPESGIVTRAYYEYAKKGISVVVTKESANPGISGVDVVGIDADHGSICKPTARNDHYERLTGPIKTAIEQCPVFKETHLAVLRLGKRFERLSQLTAAERQKVTKDVIHKVEESLGREFGDASAATDSGEGGLPEFQPAAWQRSLAATSPYDLDRIILNVWHQYRGGLSKSDPARAVRLEAQRLGVALEEGGGMTLVPLYYAARALAVQKDSGGAKLGITAKTDVEDASELVAKLVKTRDMDGNSKTTNILKRILA